MAFGGRLGWRTVSLFTMNSMDSVFSWGRLQVDSGRSWTFTAEAPRGQTHQDDVSFPQSLFESPSSRSWGIWASSSCFTEYPGLVGLRNHRLDPDDPVSPSRNRACTATTFRLPSFGTGGGMGEPGHGSGARWNILRWGDMPSSRGSAFGLCGLDVQIRTAGTKLRNSIIG